MKLIQIYKNNMGICEQVRKKDQEHERLSNKKVEPDQNRFTWFTHSAMMQRLWVFWVLVLHVGGQCHGCRGCGCTGCWYCMWVGSAMGVEVVGVLGVGM